MSHIYNRGLTCRFALIEPQKKEKKKQEGRKSHGESSLPAEAGFRYLKFLRAGFPATLTQMNQQIGGKPHADTKWPMAHYGPPHIYVLFYGWAGESQMAGTLLVIIGGLF